MHNSLPAINISLLTSLGPPAYPDSIFSILSYTMSTIKRGAGPASDGR